MRKPPLLVTLALVLTLVVIAWLSRGSSASMPSITLTYSCPENVAADDASRITARLADLRLPASVEAIDASHLRANVEDADAEDVVRSLFGAHRLEIRAVDEAAMQALATSALPPGVSGSTTPRTEVTSSTRAPLAAMVAPEGAVMRIGCDGGRCRAWALGPVAVASEDVADASASSRDEGATLGLTLTATGRASLARLTTSAIGSRVAMLLDDHVLMVPVVQSAITGGHVSITLGDRDGGYALAAATVSALRLGPLACSHWTAQ